MKTNILIVAAMAFSIVGFSQKSEIKAAEKAFKKGDAATAKTALEGASSLIDGADSKVKAQYYFLRGRVYADLAAKGDDTAFDEAITALNATISTEEESGKIKYTGEAKQKLAGISADLINSAVKDNADKKYKSAADKLYKGYTMRKNDTIYLYYAAGSAVQGGHFEDALKYYNELKEVGYNGSELKYTAVNNETQEVETMEKQQRNLFVKAGTHSNPKEEKTPAKTTEIVKNIALIYTQLGQDEKAVAAYKDARANDPNDVNLILSEANLHFKQGDKETFKKLMAEATAIAPDNPDLHYNIGVVNMEQGNIKEARASYIKALEIKPDYANALLNLSTTYVNEGNALIDELNSLGNSRKDIQRYEEIKQQKDDLFTEGAGILENALKNSPDDKNILSQLKNIYGALGDNENFKRVKGLLGE